jgi:hypothetical protein
MAMCYCGSPMNEPWSHSPVALRVPLCATCVQLRIMKRPAASLQHFAGSAEPDATIVRPARDLTLPQRWPSVLGGFVNADHFAFSPAW